MDTTLKVSVVIATFNRRPLLGRTLPTVLAQDFPADQYEVIVVDDGSTDGTAEFLRGVKADCAFSVLEQPNQGQAVALNTGLRAARGDWVLFLDDDNLCHGRLLRAHVAAHADADPAVVFGVCSVATESPRTLATDWMQACTDDWLRRLQRQGGPRFPQDATVFFNCSAPGATLRASGGFDEELARVRHFDADLGLRLWKMGARFRFQPEAIVHQIYVKTAQVLVHRDARQSGRNELVLCRKHPEVRHLSLLAGLGPASLRRRVLGELAARSPLSAEPLLRLPFWAAERLRALPLVRRLGVRLLQARQNIVMLRSALRAAGAWEALRCQFAMGLAVLLYRRVGPPRFGISPAQTIPLEQFERHLRRLTRHGYSGICPRDWLAWHRHGRPLPHKPVLITCDCGGADLALYALPLLRRYGFPAAVFLATAEVNRKCNPADSDAMTAGQIRQWAAQGIEFGACGRTGVDLTTLCAAALEEEVAGSAKELADILGAPVASFAYPRGRQNEKVLATVRSAFELAFTTDEGLNDLTSDLHLLRRTAVSPGEWDWGLACRLRFGRNLLPRLGRLAAERAAATAGTCSA